MTYRQSFIAMLAIGLGLFTACSTGSDQSTAATESSATVAPTAAPTTVAATLAPTTVATTVPATSASTLPPTTAAPAPAPAPSQPLMPAVVCMNLQEAQDLIQTFGVFYSRSADATGEGRSQLIDSNWQVVAQTPDPGTPFGEGDALLFVVKYGEQPNPC